VGGRGQCLGAGREAARSQKNAPKTGRIPPVSGRFVGRVLSMIKAISEKLPACLGSWRGDWRYY